MGCEGHKRWNPKKLWRAMLHPIARARGQRWTTLCPASITIAIEEMVPRGRRESLVHRNKGVERLSCSAYPIRKVPKNRKFLEDFPKPMDLKAGSFLIKWGWETKVANFGSKFRTLFLIPHTCSPSYYNVSHLLLYYLWGQPWAEISIST